MNASHDLERDIERWMEDVVPRRAPSDLAPAIVRRTSSMQPRPGWLARFLEPAMDTHIPLRRVGFGRTARQILLALLAVAVIGGGALVAGQILRSRTLPPPFGIAGNGQIVVDVGGALVVMRPDGSGQRPLQLPYSGVTDAAFSRDGTRLAAWATPDASKPHLRQLIVAGADGSDSYVVSPETYDLDSLYRLDWSADGRRLAFSDRLNALYIAAPDSRTIVALAPRSDIFARRNPAWAPDGRLAYRCLTADWSLHLCVLSADFQRETVLATSKGTEYAFQGSSWSHDGKRIAYYMDDVVNRGWDVATIDPEIGVEQILTRDTAEHMIYPIWSPDDTYITVAGGIIAADGSGVRLIGDGDCGWTQPSPDGRFAICTMARPRLQLGLYPIDGGPPSFIPIDGLGESVPAWQRVAD